MVVRTTAEATPPRYFWSDWFTGHTFRELATVFILLSAVDLLATVNMLQARVGVQEGNALANFVFHEYGPWGFAVYKAVMVGFILLVIRLVYRHNAPLGVRLLWFGLLLMAVIALIHIAILGGMLSWHFTDQLSGWR